MKETSIPKDFLIKKTNNDPDENLSMLNDPENPSKLLSLLGKYNPPQNCDIPQKIDRQFIITKI